MNTDQEWERWGAGDPYYGVLTNPKYRTAVLTTQAKEEFFYSGRCHVHYVLDMCRRYIDPAFTPQRVLDFGCGVGRLLIPFAELSKEVVGIDISSSMLAEAQRNCEERGAGNVKLILSDDTLSAVHGQFNLVHSCIVFQHIEVERGRRLFAQLINRMLPEGIAALHVTFAWDVYAANFGQPPADLPPSSPTPLAHAKAHIRRLFVSPASQEPETRADPEMEMYYYNLNELLFLVQRSGAKQVHTAFTDHGGALGVFLFFRKQA